MAVTFLSISFVLVCVSFAFEKVKVNFVKEWEHVNKIPSTGLQISYDGNSLHQCIRMCASESTCQVAYHRTFDSKCALYELPVFKPTSTVIDAGTGFDVYRSWHECESSGYTYYRAGRLCVRLYEISRRITSDDADNNCATANASLMSVDTKLKRDFLYRFLKKAHSYTFEYLVGLKWDRSAWRWRNGAVFQKSLYLYRQLNNYDDRMKNCAGGHCVFFRLRTSTQSPFYIVDHCCKRVEHSYICEKDVD